MLVALVGGDISFEFSVCIILFLLDSTYFHYFGFKFEHRKLEAMSEIGAGVSRERLLSTTGNW